MLSSAPKAPTKWIESKTWEGWNADFAFGRGLELRNFALLSAVGALVGASRVGHWGYPWWVGAIGGVVLTLLVRLAFFVTSPRSSTVTSLTIDGERFRFVLGGIFLDVASETLVGFSAEKAKEQGKGPKFQLRIHRKAGESLEMPLYVDSADEAQFVAERASAALSSERRRVEPGSRAAPGKAPKSPAKWTEQTSRDGWRATLPRSYKELRSILLGFAGMMAIFVFLSVGMVAVGSQEMPSAGALSLVLRVLVPALLASFGSMTWLYFRQRRPSTFAIGKGRLRAEFGNETKEVDIATIDGVLLQGTPLVTHLCFERQGAPVLRVPLAVANAEEARFVASRINAALDDARSLRHE